MSEILSYANEEERDVAFKEKIAEFVKLIENEPNIKAIALIIANDKNARIYRLSSGVAQHHMLGMIDGAVKLTSLMMDDLRNEAAKYE